MRNPKPESVIDTTAADVATVPDAAPAPVPFAVSPPAETVETLPVTATVNTLPDVPKGVVDAIMAAVHCPKNGSVEVDPVTLIIRKVSQTGAAKTDFLLYPQLKAALKKAKIEMSNAEISAFYERRTAMYKVLARLRNAANEEEGFVPFTFGESASGNVRTAAWKRPNNAKTALDRAVALCKANGLKFE